MGEVVLARPLVLGSASPRRQQILSELGLSFTVQPSAAPEPPFEGGNPAEYAAGLAKIKAETVLAQCTDPQVVVLAADTIVVIDGQVLGKPKDDQDALGMLAQLAGRDHTVITAVELAGQGLGEWRLVERSEVWFRVLNAEDRQRYVATGEGVDKAGAYAIQGIGSGLVERVSGSYSNVVGLPASQTIDLLRSAGVLAQWP